MTHADSVAPFSRRINRRHDLSIYLICREQAMIDVHNFRFQLNDGGVSTSTTGSRSSALSCPRPMTREYESLFFRSASPSSSSSSLPPCLTSHAHSSLAPLTHCHPVFRSLLILCLCLLHIPHGPLFPVRDPLRRVSPGQVLETRGFHRKSILRPFHPSFLLVSSSLAGFSRLFVLPSFTSTLFPALSVVQSATLSRLGCPSTW